MSPTAVDQHGRQINFKRMANGSQNGIKVWESFQLQSEAGYWAAGYRAAIDGPCFAGSSTICFYAREGGGREGFLKLANGKRLS